MSPDATERTIALPAAEGASMSPSPPEPIFDPADGGFRQWQPQKLTGKHLVMIEYHLAGHSHREIGKQFDYSEVQVGMVIRSDLAQEYIKTRVNDLDGEFQGLFRKVIDVINDGLEHEDHEIALKAADKWLRAHGRYAPKKSEGVALTAEEVIAKLLSDRSSVTVNIDNRQQYSYRSEADAST